MRNNNNNKNNNYKPYEQVIYTQTRIRPEERDGENFLELWNTNGPPNLDQTSRPSDNQQKKENLPNKGLILAERRLKKKKDMYVDLARGVKKTKEYERDGNTNYSWCTWNDPKGIGKAIGRLGNKRASGDHPECSIIMIGQNTEKSPGDMGILAVTQTLMKDHQLKLEEKSLIIIIIIVITQNLYQRMRRTHSLGTLRYKCTI